MSIKIVAENKKARFDFHILDVYEAGMVLVGSEVKSLRAGHCQLKDSYISFVADELFLQKAHISQYQASSYNNHAPERLRKLLLSRHEISRIIAGIQEKGQTCVPLKVYFKDGFAKVEIAMAKGKKKGDKREAEKTKDVNRELQRHLRKGK
jgi:SsrA-binding protein